MNPTDVVFILMTYLAFVLRVGPLLMEKQRPMHAKWLLPLYTVFKVITSGLLAHQFLLYIIDKGLFPRKCEPDELTTYILATLYWKYMSIKILNLCDTIFYILRKKYSQVTFIHVFNHALVVIITWSSLKYDPSDRWVFVGAMNCIIHSLLSAYYVLAKLGGTLSKCMWLKHLCVVQFIQFVLAITYFTVLYHSAECPLNTASYWIGLGYLCLFTFQLTDFYKKRYKTLKQD